ncbi:MAG: caspase family protein [Haliscomenobacter sp.]|uniref:caspase family protein n=1 Tax=Haliscomenobacter sp. TaxID=2717303 RepID=UPI0029A33B9B|nr:caspase family protein [Haliscomenobacter sp.]MDX2069589.1 caspase family protein [Haliscomenobacter sp.]
MPPMSHATYVRALAVSPDGAYVLSAAGYLDNTVLLWSASGKLLKILEGHENDLYDAEISGDGKHMLTLETGSWTLHLWDNQGKELKKIEGFGITDACFSADHQFIYAGTASGDIRIYDLSGTFHQAITAGDQVINQVVCSKEYVGSSDEAGIIRVFDKAGKLLKTLDGHGQQSIEGLAFSPNGQQLLSGAHDKMVLLWDWQNEKILKKLGPQQSQVRSVAFSPDGKYLASAGPDEEQLYLWDSQGNLLKKFQTDRINELVFTPDSQGLLVAPTNKAALLYDLQGQMVRSYSNDASSVTSVGFSPFSPDSLFILTGGEGIHIRLWDAVSGEAEALEGQNDFNTPAAFNPQDPSLLIAQTGDSISSYNLYEGVYTKADKGKYVGHSALAFHPDGDHFLLSNFTGGINFVTKSDQEWEVQDIQLDSNRVTILSFSPDGQHFLLATDRDLVPHYNKGVYEERKQPYSGKGFPAELRRVEDFQLVHKFGTSADQAVFSPDGKYVATNEAYSFAIYDAKTGRQVFLMPKSGDDVFPLVTCLTFTPNSQRLLVGFSSNVIHEYNLIGQLLREYKGHRSTIRTLAVSPNGKFLLSGSSDNSAKIWSTQTGAELATLMAIGTEDWMVATPDGLFDASPGAMDSLYFVVGLEIVAIDQLKERYYEPGLLAKVLGFGEGPLRKVVDLDGQNLALYPELEAKLLDDVITVKLNKRSGGIGRVSLRLDDMEIAPDVNPGRQSSFTIKLSNYADYFVNGESNPLALVCYNAEGWLSSPEYAIAYVPGGKGKDKPVATTALNDQTDQALVNTLYALVVGTSDYKGTALDLKFPDKDATAYRDMLQLAGKDLFGARMQIKLLTTEKGGVRPTKTAIRAALLEFAAKAEPKDVLLVYFSGHGTTWPENSPTSQFYYLSTDNESFELNNASNRQFAIAQDSIQAWIRGVKARKRILILDACNSGEVVKQLDEGGKGSTLSTDQRRALERMKDRAGLFVLASSSADKLSYEDPRFGHGLLTYSLLNNMPKVAAQDKNSFIDVGKLFQEVREDVPKLASALSKTQEPKLIGMEDFSIGILKAGTPVKLPTAKKIIIRSDFSNKKRLDPLKLKVEVNTQLEAMLADPALPFAYYPSDKAAGTHYFINGEYELVGTTVKVTAYLYKSDQENELETFSVEGPNTNLKALVEQLLVKVKEALVKLK